MGRDIPFRFSVNLEYFSMRLITQTPTTATTTTVFKVFSDRTPIPMYALAHTRRGISYSNNVQSIDFKSFGFGWSLSTQSSMFYIPEKERLN